MTSRKRSPHEFIFKEELGHGSYSTVYKALDKRDLKKTYAIKVCSKQHIIKESKVKYVTIEKNTLNLLARGNHPGIVKLYYTFHDEENLYFVLDYAPGGELLTLLHKMGTFNNTWANHFAAQLVDTLEFMHSQGVIHRDLKPENVLLNKDGILMITDFGAAASPSSIEGKKETDVDDSNGNGVVTEDENGCSSFVGTAEYVSPELLLYNKCSFGSDIWALGCMIYQFVQGFPPFRGENELKTFEKIVSLDYTWNPDKVSNIGNSNPQVVNLVRKMLTLDTTQRASIADIKKDPWFATINWNDKKKIWRGIWQVQQQIKPNTTFVSPSVMRSNMNHQNILQNRQLHVIDTPLRNIPVTKQKRKKPAKEFSTTSSIVEWRKKLGISSSNISPTNNSTQSISNIVVDSTPIDNIVTAPLLPPQPVTGMPMNNAPMPINMGTVNQTQIPHNAPNISGVTTTPRDKVMRTRYDNAIVTNGTPNQNINGSNIHANGSTATSPNKIKYTGQNITVAPISAKTVNMNSPHTQEHQSPEKNSTTSTDDEFDFAEKREQPIPEPNGIYDTLSSPLKTETSEDIDTNKNGISKADILPQKDDQLHYEPLKIKPSVGILKQDFVYVKAISYDAAGPDMAISSYKKINDGLITSLVSQHKTAIRPTNIFPQLLTLYKDGSLAFKEIQTNIRKGEKSLNPMVNLGDTNLSMYDFEFNELSRKGFLILERYKYKLWFISLPSFSLLATFPQELTKGLIVNCNENWIDCFFRTRKLIEDGIDITDKVENIDLNSNDTEGVQKERLIDNREQVAKKNKDIPKSKPPQAPDEANASLKRHVPPRAIEKPSLRSQNIPDLGKTKKNPRFKSPPVPPINTNVKPKNVTNLASPVMKRQSISGSPSTPTAPVPHRTSLKNVQRTPNNVSVPSSPSYLSAKQRVRPENMHISSSRFEVIQSIKNNDQLIDKNQASSGASAAFKNLQKK
ncbi:protein kinase PKH3 [Nakaseomyces bracarensis]|uniref:protein kinase PKH3 n=1 Tax=Nakaseomyces bracarensis TaxID=273131 RepID=UPI0038728E73